MWSFSSVCHHMNTECLFRSITVATVVTFKRFCPGVGTNVVFQASLVVKSATFSTFVWTLPGVGSHMHL